MKKWIKITGMLLLMLPVMVQATDYPATNVTITLPAGQRVPVSYAYDPATTNGNTIATLFAGLPSGSEIDLWNNTSQSWISFTKNRTGWGAGGTNRLTIGVGALVKSSVAINIVFSGTIPTNALTAISKANGVKFLAYPYPMDVVFTNTQIAKTAANGEKILFWTNNSWVVYSKLRTGWVPSATNLVLKNCGAFAYFAYTNSIVNEIRPY